MMTIYETSFLLAGAPVDIERAAELLKDIPLAPFTGGEPVLATVITDVRWQLDNRGTEGTIALTSSRPLADEERVHASAWLRRIASAISQSLSELSHVRTTFKVTEMALERVEHCGDALRRELRERDLRDAIDRARREWNAAGRCENLTDAILREVMQVVPVA